MDIYTNISIKGDLSVTSPTVQLLDSLMLKGTNIISASNINLGSTSGWIISISGNAVINSFGTANAGIIRYLIFTSALTIIHNTTSLILPYNTNITTQIGDSLTAISLGDGNWKVLNYQSVTPPITTITSRKSFLLMGG